MENIVLGQHAVDIFAVDAAGEREFTPVPTGKYRAITIDGGLKTSQQGTPGYSVRFEIAEGKYIKQSIWLNCWFTEKSAPFAKRDLAKLGIYSQADLKKPLKRNQLCELDVSLRTTDEGKKSNEVRSFKVLGQKALTISPFAPNPSSQNGASSALPADQHPGVPDGRGSVHPQANTVTTGNPSTVSDAQVNAVIKAMSAPDALIPEAEFYAQLNVL